MNKASDIYENEPFRHLIFALLQCRKETRFVPTLSITFFHVHYNGHQDWSNRNSSCFNHTVLMN